MVIQQRLYTVDEFERLLTLPENRDKLLELINGEIVEKVVTQKHGIITGNLVTDINIYLRQNKIGRAAVEAHHRAPDDPHNSRIPDISVVLDLSKPVSDEGTAPFMPDLCVEVRSPSNSFKELREKARYYLANGTRLVWLVLPEQKVVEVYTPDDEFVLGEDEMLTGGDVLPGFAISVKSIFDYE